MNKFAKKAIVNKVNNNVQIFIAGSFAGNELEPGTFHGNELESGTFHHLYPENMEIPGLNYFDGTSDNDVVCSDDPQQHFSEDDDAKPDHLTHPDAI
ncbi:MAG: hypothetical protein JEZ07_07345 [Phycisphaerae bacterium]|nr:hypothetical protein [Phycisphaerae bacterium]